MDFEQIKNIFKESDQTAERQERTIEEISREMDEAKEERRRLGERYRAIKERGSTGSVVQQKMFDVDAKIRSLRKELGGKEKESGIAENSE